MLIEVLIGFYASILILFVNRVEDDKEVVGRGAEDASKKLLCELPYLGPWAGIGVSLCRRIKP
ncbi:hypothetical protein PMO31116_04675 [Pandoraea morbifera]|uniref:Uncharacterized protein n=1 Tax=Pandoraea morbifera TaxID=2508300 RepID=A0A5E4YR01_9BURK|nr:hypothetical protein PMO31116_04675 [Pandoraea morbifera]